MSALDTVHKTISSLCDNIDGVFVLQCRPRELAQSIITALENDVKEMTNGSYE